VRCEGNPRSIKVLMYHRIVNDKAVSQKHWTSLHVDDFRKQLSLLDQWGYTALSLRDYQMFLDGKLDLPNKPVILTFDDGYLDFYQCAYPLLHEFGFKAVVFVLGERKIKSNFWDERLGIGGAPLMDGRHILELHEEGFEIGSHSLSHARLTELPDDMVWEQVSRSRILLEILLDAPVTSFSYPYGLLNSAVKNAVRESGYTFACSVGSGPAAFNGDCYEIRRITIQSNTGISGFAVRLLTPFQYFDWTRRKASEVIGGLIKPRKGQVQPAHGPEQQHEQQGILL